MKKRIVPFSEEEKTAIQIIVETITNLHMGRYNGRTEQVKDNNNLLKIYLNGNINPCIEINTSEMLIKVNNPEPVYFQLAQELLTKYDYMIDERTLPRAFRVEILDN